MVSEVGMMTFSSFHMRDHEVAVGVLPDVHDRLAVYGWVADLILRDECII